MGGGGRGHVGGSGLGVVRWDVNEELKFLGGGVGGGGLGGVRLDVTKK